MGTTSTIAGLLGDTLYLAQVGDSRAYLVRDGQARQITKDQSLIQKLVEAGELTMEEAEEIGKAGGIHDVGKIGIDPAILSNTGRLTTAEMDQMRLHPQLGADIVSRFSTSGPITSYVLHHHEWWNGNGYPAGLVGEKIPLGARIIAVADTFDALTSKRPYREPLSAADALLVLRDGAGTQWDTEVVAAFFGYAKSIGIPLPKTDNPTLLRWANGTTA